MPLSFRPFGFFTFVLEQNARDMLRFISWTEFNVTLLVAAVIYYGIVLGKFYRKEIISIVTGRKTTAGASVTKTGPGSGQAGRAGSGQPVVAVGDSKPKAAEGLPGVGQAMLFDKTEETGDSAPELFTVMEKVVGTLKGVVNQAVAEGIHKEELMDHFREVLGNYHYLKGTPYQGNIDRFLVRTCSSNFSLVLEDRELVDLWG